MHGQAQVRMITSSSGVPYEHPLVRIIQPECRIDYGWYAHILHDVPSTNLKIEKVVLPDINPYLAQSLSHKSVQA